MGGAQCVAGRGVRSRLALRNLHRCTFRHLSQVGLVDADWGEKRSAGLVQMGRGPLPGVTRRTHSTSSRDSGNVIDQIPAGLREDETGMNRGGKTVRQCCLPVHAFQGKTVRGGAERDIPGKKKKNTEKG